MNVKPTALSLILAVAGICVFAEDKTVAVGETLNVTSDTTYETLIVNGSLTIKEGVKLSLTKFFVGQAESATPAAVLLERNAKVEMASWTESDSDKRFIIGDGHPAEFTMQEGSVVTASGCRLGNDSWEVVSATAPVIKLTLNDASFDTKGGTFQSRYKSKDSGYEAAWVVLNGTNAVLDVPHVAMCGAKARMSYRFNGGRMVFDDWFNYGNSAYFQTNGSSANETTVLESVNGHPIRLYFSDGKSGNSFFNALRSDGVFLVKGTGPLQPEGPGLRPLWIPSSGSGSLKLENEAGIAILNGITLPFNAASVTKFEANEHTKITVYPGGKLDLAGNSLSVDSLSSGGTVTNASETAATLTVGVDDGEVLFACPPAEDLPIVKRGSGALRIPSGQLANVTVTSGSLELLNRKDIGFPYYRFWVDEGSSNYRLSEIEFSNGATDVTSDWTAMSRIKKGGGYYGAGPTGTVDRIDETVWDDRSRAEFHDGRTNRCFFVTHFCGAPGHSFDWYGPLHNNESEAEALANPDLPLTPVGVARKVTAYRLKSGQGGFPGNWRLQGGFLDGIVNNTWQELDFVRNATSPGNYTWDSVRDLCYTSACVKAESLVLADGITWEFDVHQGWVDLDALTVEGSGTIVLKNVTRVGDVKTLPVHIASCATADRLASWTVVCEGKPEIKRTLALKDGYLVTNGAGLILVVR